MPTSLSNMETIAPSTNMSVADQLLLDTFAWQLDDPDIPAHRLLEMLSEVTAMAKRYGCNFHRGPSDAGILPAA